MPKNNINYSNTIVYKIYCKDELITDIYVGHTTNFVIRKYQHKVSCKKSEVKIYKTIRNNGGWENWNMVEIAKYNCNDSIEARIMEQKHYEELNATLNSCPPYVDTAKYFCSICNKQCNGQLAYETHINCILHNKKTQVETNSCEKAACKFSCLCCEYNTVNKYDYKKHCNTVKHANAILATNMSQISQMSQKEIFECNCGKTYKDNSGLWRHKKKCNNNSNINEVELTDKELIAILIKQNQKLMNIVKNGTNNNNNTNSHNTTINDSKPLN